MASRPSVRHRRVVVTKQRAQGYNGSQCWDLSFATQAIAEARLGDAAYLEDCVALNHLTDPDPSTEAAQVARAP